VIYVDGSPKGKVNESICLSNGIICTRFNPRIHDWCYVMLKENDPTINELRKIFIDNGLEFYIKKEKKGIIKVHFLVREENDVDTLDHK
jgi:hypothetical protein